jgi:hypothetical protein
MSDKEKLDLYFKFFMLGGTLEKKSFYDEEGVEGWVFTIDFFNEEKEFFETGVWNEIPDMPDELITHLNNRSGVL